MVELLFLPSVYAPCPTCHGARYNAKTLEIEYRGKNIADVLAMTVDAACDVLRRRAARAAGRSTCCARSASGYLRLGQPATELSGGEAQRIKLATELQRTQRGRHALRPRRADHRPAPGRRREAHGQLDGLVDAGNTVIVVEHDMRVVAGERLGHRHRPGAGEEGGRVVAEGTPEEVAEVAASRTAPYLSEYRGAHTGGLEAAISGRT